MPRRLIRDIIRGQNLVVVAPAETVAAAARLMARHRLGALPVVDDGRLVGIFTERDIVTRVVSGGRDPETIAVADVMTQRPVTASPDEAFGAALLAMHEGGFRHMPVVEAGRVVGVVSLRDALGGDLLDFERQRQRHDDLLEGMR